MTSYDAFTQIDFLIIIIIAFTSSIKMNLHKLQQVALRKTATIIILLYYSVVTSCCFSANDKTIRAYLGN